MCLTSARVAIVGLVAATLAVTGCGAQQRPIAGTRIADNSVNHTIIDTIEAYRQAVERRDATSLMLMASEHYWEDSGTVSGGDDYGLDGLKTVLVGRFQKATDVRFSMRYVAIRRACPAGHSADDLVDGCVAHVEVLVDASYTIQDARGQDRRPDKRDQNELIMRWTCGKKDEGCKWLFISGM